MSFVLILIIHATFLLTIAAQRNLTPFGKASQISTLRVNSNAINAILPPISNTFQNGHTIYCTHTDGYYDPNPKPAWWMFEFESAYITDIQIYYREGQAKRMDGFKLYVTNTSTIPPNSYLCYEDGPGLPNITQTIPCNQLGKYVIYYDDKGSTFYGPIVELCYVAINGCQKSRWGSDCEQLCTENCIERNCYPQNGSCVWGCNAKNCLNDICDKDTAVCTNGCKNRRTGIYCNNYNIASDSLVWQDPSGSQSPDLAKDGDITTCSKTMGSSIKFQVDLKEKSFVTGLFIILGGTTKDGHHIIYTSNDSNTWKSGPVLYNGTNLPTEIHFDAVFRFLTYVPQVRNPTIELELCEIGIIGCPPTHYGPLCNTTCPPNCNGPCDIDVGICTFGCMNGWIGNSCDQACDNGYFGNKCANRCYCLTEPCSKGDGICTPSGCNEGWYGDSCNKACEDGYFGDNCTFKCNCMTGTCNSLTGECPGDGSQSRSKETPNAAAIGGGVAAFIIVALLIVAAFVLYKRRLISTQTGAQKTSSDTTTYETRNSANNSQQNEQQYEDLIRMDPTSPYQELTTPSVSNEYEQIDNTFVNLSLQI